MANFFSSQDSKETRTMSSKSDNIEVMVGRETDEIIEEHFWPFFTKIPKRFNQ